MPSKLPLFGVDIRLPSSPIYSPRVGKPGKSSPTASVNELKSPSMDHIKRPGLGLGKRLDSDKKERSLSKDKSKGKAKEPEAPPKPKAVKLGMFMESPPILFIGTPTQSTGALMSGRLQLTPNVAEATVEKITMYLECVTTTRRPVEARCRECLTTVRDLFEWNFLSKPKVLWADRGMQEIPFSHLIPGHLPASTHGQIGSIDYSLHVRAILSNNEEVEFRRDVVFQRALVPGNEKTSVRIFPPTNLQLQVTLPNVMHPIGDFPVSCRMTGIVSKQADTQTRWRLRKLTWRIEEHETMISPACPKHAAKVGGEGKGIQHEYTREVGKEEIKEGWKTDFDDGTVEGEFTCHIDSSTSAQTSMEAQNGLKIEHHLVIELVIAEEWAQNRRPLVATPTGAARVLRTQFALNTTQRLGMGLSWDDEMPPSYEDVPDSPPHYQNERTTMELYEGDDLHEDVEHLSI